MLSVNLDTVQMPTVYLDTVQMSTVQLSEIRSEILHVLTIFHAKRDSTQTYVFCNDRGNSGTHYIHNIRYIFAC